MLLQRTACKQKNKIFSYERFYEERLLKERKNTNGAAKPKHCLKQENAGRPTIEGAIAIINLERTQLRVLNKR
jgi:hypothetical protein